MELRQQILENLRALASAEKSPGDVADWALEVMQGEDPELRNEDSWDALDLMAGADLLDPDEPLHDRAQFQEWLARYESGEGEESQDTH